ncbi:MAG TPA: HNH endonuclease signature motif containing protein [Methanosarcina sp.]|nr:HNH endonuclease signature motif containing protein [Methanosarcina sp.]
MKSGSKIYREIWSNYYGPIPKDDLGRSFEIHHIDGDHSNNDITNLKCVSLQEHYDIHYAQGDYGACLLITRKLKLTSEELSNLAKLNNQKRIADGTHNLLRRADGTSHASDRVAAGTHNFQSEEFKKLTQERQQNRVKKGTHNFLGAENNKKRIEEKSHNFVTNNPANVVWICEVCSKTGKGAGNYKRYHGTNCKLKSI